MKTACVLPFLLSLFLAGNSVEISHADFMNILKTNLEGFKVDVPKSLVEEFLVDLNEVDTRAGEIVAVVNDYVDRLLPNVKNAILNYGLDPMSLPDTTLNLIPTGTVDLSSGWLQDTSTLARNGDVEVTYSSTTRKMVLILPIKFDALLFTYKYHTQIPLISITGDTDGKVENVDIKATLSFDFATYEVSLDTFDITNSGSISLKFSGNGLLDWITNAMTSVVSLFLHPLIIRIIQSIVEGGLDSLVDALNDLIKSILSPGTTLAV